MGSPGPYRGELGEVTEGSIRTLAFARWPGRIAPGTSTHAMFSIMDFMPTLAGILGVELPKDRPIDGVDQSDVLFGKSATGHRDSLLSFVGPDLLAVRWKQWRLYFTDVHSTGSGPQRLPGFMSASAPLTGYPHLYNEDLQVISGFPWVVGPGLKVVEEYLESVKEHPNPPAPNITQFRGLVDD